MRVWKLRGKCASCRRNRWFVRTPEVTVMGTLKAHGRELLCGPCGAKLRSAIRNPNG